MLSILLHSAAPADRILALPVVEPVLMDLEVAFFMTLSELSKK